MAIARYQKKISGPFLDRIDIHVKVPCVDYEKLADKRNVEDSKTIRARVQATLRMDLCSQNIAFIQASSRSTMQKGEQRILRWCCSMVVRLQYAQRDGKHCYKGQMMA